ncbi:MAG: transcription termination factor Rho [Lachnospiraceae bacterium]|jgi:transcription termination factor Rho|nr:transcription termination factor Rho [Lachnospiraceae bacterium]MEE3460419.1 transcription termination factor Rho [Lachnospiraceae bacterium]
MDIEKISIINLRDVAKLLSIKSATTFSKDELVEKVHEAEKKNPVLVKNIIDALERGEDISVKKRKYTKRDKKGDSKASAKNDGTDNSSGSTEGQADKNSSVSNVKNETADKPKRKRGRPRKYPLPEADEIKEKQSVSAKTDLNVIKEKQQVSAMTDPGAADRIERDEPVKYQPEEKKAPVSAVSFSSENGTKVQFPEVREGVLEILPDGYGFIRVNNYTQSSNDVYISPAMVRKWCLKSGDIINGNIKPKGQGDHYAAITFINSINGKKAEEVFKRPRFEKLTPVFPDQRIRLETPDGPLAMRMMDLISPIGKGQRGMIVSQPKAGKTTLIKQVAHAVRANYPEMHIMVLLIDERPEEVTDIRESIQGDNVEVISSTFDELPENHKRVSEVVIERAKRMVEYGKDVIILLDSITRLARAYNLTVSPSGKTLSGGLDPTALYMPKKFFGAARNIREGGSLTILATALVDTGSKMDDVVFEEFKGTGNMELVLDRDLSEKMVFPAINMQKSGTRRDDLLFTQPELEAAYVMKKAFLGAQSDDAVQKVIKLFKQTKNNQELVDILHKVRL